MLLLLGACAVGEVTDEASDADTDDAEANGDEDAAPQDESGEAFELRFANFLGPDAAQVQAMQWWADEVEERTNGRVTVEFFHGGALLDATDTLPGIGDGRAEMGHVAHFYHPGELPLSTVSELPFLVQNPQMQARTFNALYAASEDFRAEWEAMGVHVLHFNPSGVIILGSSEPIAGPADLEGRQVRAVGFAAEAFDAIGANPIALPAPEIYESLQRGLIDSYSSFPFEVITAFQLQEVAPYVADPGLGNYLITAAPITLSVWESMPPEIQETLTAVSDDLMADAVWDIYAAVEDEVCDAIADADGQVMVFSDEDVTAWQQTLGGEIRSDWLDTVNAPRETAERFLNEYLDGLESHRGGVDFASGVRRCAER